MNYLNSNRFPVELANFSMPVIEPSSTGSLFLGKNFGSFFFISLLRKPRIATRQKREPMRVSMDQRSQKMRGPTMRVK